jgi:hypothetical protein
VVLEGAVDLLPVGVLVDAQRVADVDSLDHEHAVLDLDLAGRFCSEASFAGVDLARLQRTPEGARQSARGGGDDVVERGGSLGFATRCNPVVLGDSVVDAEDDRLGLGRQVGAAERSAHTLYPHP